MLIASIPTIVASNLLLTVGFELDRASILNFSLYITFGLLVITHYLFKTYNIKEIYKQEVKKSQIFLLVIFVSLLLSVRSQRHAEELNEVIKGIEGQGEDMEGFIRDEYKINSIDEAMAELEKLKAGMAKFIYKITEIIQ